MKIISMYLPQYHRVKENDEWWGEGFTDWTTIKNAVKFCDQQYQPRIPLNKNYYDLQQKETMRWQTELMKKYGIDAQCIYHYWFRDGRQILEKPAQNLLQWRDVYMPFCFCWANESWARTWSRISNKNPWANTFEKKRGLNDSGILLEQKYGEEGQWKQHFEYLIDFFKDDRYIKIDNKPVFVIYKAALIPCLAEMTKKWNQWAREYGFAGVYIIGANGNQASEKSLDEILYHEPQHTMSIFDYRKKDRTNIQILDYDEVWEEILNFYSTSKKVIYGGFVDYDDTPRRGKEGIIVENADPERFKVYLAELIAKNIANGNDMIFINAWNEWGEGMYLEPDQKYGEKYLDAVRYARKNYEVYLNKYKLPALKGGKQLVKEVELLAAKSAKYESYWRILDAWLCMKEDHVSLEEYFINRNIYSIAIYGVGILGKHLIKELKNGKIQVMYGIDRKADALQMEIVVYPPNAEFFEVDLIVVTVTYAYEDIKKQLEARGYKNVISLEQIIMEISR